MIMSIIDQTECMHITLMSQLRPNFQLFPCMYPLEHPTKIFNFITLFNLFSIIQKILNKLSTVVKIVLDVPIRTDFIPNDKDSIADPLPLAPYRTPRITVVKIEICFEVFLTIFKRNHF